MPSLDRCPPVILGLALSLLCACAEGTGSDADDAGDSTGDVESDHRDLVTVDLPASDPDLTPDPDVEPELAGECVPFTATCTEDGRGIRRCSAAGELFDPSQCTNNEVCEEADGTPSCVACTPDVNCPPPVTECAPDSTFCADYQTAARCDSEGFVEVELGCGLGRCFGGGCNTQGNDTAEACTANNGCAGRTCLCGTDDGANGGTGLCGGNMAAGYCTTSNCRENGCRPDDEVCADFEISGAFGGTSMCLATADCGLRLGACAAGHRGDGHVCREMPVTSADGDRRTWELGCWVSAQADPDVPCANASCIAPIGAACNDNTDCIGGLCLSLPGGLSYCAATCDETHECPSYASCVRLEPDSDSHFCLARAQASDCPRMVDNFDIGPVGMTGLGGVSTQQVCYYVGD